MTAYIALRAASLLPTSVKVSLKAAHRSFRFWRDDFFSVSLDRFRRALLDLGLGPGNIVFVHSAYDQMGSLRATPSEVIQILCDVVGTEGTILMPTFPMDGLSQSYLDEGRIFDVRRTPSRSGMLTEVFRRMSGTVRSLHPTHPVAARGRDAAWLTAGHEACLTPFDVGSPFSKLLAHNATVLRIGRFSAMSFRHLADHLLQDVLPYPIYSDRTVSVVTIDANGRHGIVVTRAHNPRLRCDHQVALEDSSRAGRVQKVHIGFIPLALVSVADYVEAYRNAHATGRLHYRLEKTRDES